MFQSDLLSHAIVVDPLSPVFFKWPEVLVINMDSWATSPRSSDLIIIKIAQMLSPPSGLCSNVTSSGKHSLNTLFKISCLDFLRLNPFSMAQSVLVNILLIHLLIAHVPY